MDAITIEILPDGTIKTTTDKVSMPNHSTAEGFLREMARVAGGKTERKARAKKGIVHSHTHSHDGLGEHSHEGEQQKQH